MQKDAHGVVASAFALLTIAEAAGAGPGCFSAAERAYAESKSDPARRLAARLAAKRAADEALGGGFEPADFEVLPAHGGPPRLALSERAAARLGELGAKRALLSLTHGRTHAAAAVLLVADP